MRATFLAASALLGAALAASAPAAGVDTTPASRDLQQTEIRTTLGRASGRLPHLAVPAFIVTGADAELQEAGKTLADVLWKDLEFEREYQMISQSGGAAQVAPAPAEALAFDTWSQLGADEVLVASAEGVKSITFPKLSGDGFGGPPGKADVDLNGGKGGAPVPTNRTDSLGYTQR